MVLATLEVGGRCLFLCDSNSFVQSCNRFHSCGSLSPMAFSDISQRYYFHLRFDIQGLPRIGGGFWNWSASMDLVLVQPVTLRIH